MFGTRRRADSAADRSATGEGQSVMRGSDADTSAKDDQHSRVWWKAGTAATLLLIVAAVGVVWTAVDYWDAGQQSNVAAERDSALAGAEQAMLNVTNINPGDVEGFKKRAASTLIGDVTQQLSDSGLQALAQAGPNAGKLTSSIARSALTEFDDKSHTGKSLIYVAVTAVRPNQATTSQTMGFMVSIAKDAGIWKAKTIQSLDAYAASPAPSAGQGSQSNTPAPNTQAPNDGGGN